MIILAVHNNIVTSSNIGASFSTTHNAYSFFSNIYDLLEKNGWKNIRSETDGSETFKKGKYSAFLMSPSKRIDNLIAVGVFIEEIVLDFNNYQFEFISWINKISELLGKNNIQKENNLIFSYIMENKSRCSVYGYDNNPNSLMILVQNDEDIKDINILYQQFMDNVRNKKITKVGEIDEEADLYKIGNINMIITKPSKAVDIRRKIFIVTIILYKE